MEHFQLKFLTNKQTVRMLTWLSYFQHEPEVTVAELKQRSGVSAKTIATDIAYIKQFFYGTITLDSSNRGYLFSVNQNASFLEKKRSLLENEPLFIIIESIFRNRCLNISEWSEKLHLSVSTLLRYLRRIEPILSEYNLSLNTYPVDFSGTELDIRCFFQDFYYESDITPHTVFPTQDIQNLALSLKTSDLFSEYTFISLGDFNYILFIALTRFYCGKHIEHREGYRKDLIDRANELGDLIHSNLDINLIEMNLDEKVYVYMQLLFRRSVFRETPEQSFQKLLTKNPLADRLSIQYTNLICPDKSLYKQTFPFVSSFFYSQLLKYSISPVLIHNIEDVTSYVQQELSRTYSTAISFIRKNMEHTLHLNGKQIRSLAANLTLFTESLKKTHMIKPKNIVFLLEGNYLICEYIRVTALERLGGSNTLYFPGMQDMSREYFKSNKIDIVVTNYSEYLFDDLGDVVYLLFDSMPNERNWTQLAKLINKNYSL